MKLVGFFDIEKYQNEERVFSPATVAVMNYLADCLHRLGIPVEIISPAETRKTSGKYPLRSEEIRDGVVLTQGASSGYENKILRVLTKIRSRLWVVSYLLKNTKENELVFFCDSPVLYEPLLLFRRLSRKKVSILYFASEIYQQVIPLGKIKRWMEWKLFRDADMLVVSTKLLDEKINQEGRKSVILHGTYTLTPKYTDKFDDGLIHIVYAGIINGSKGSAKAVEIADHLPEKYHIHILGFGLQNDVEELKRSIEESNRKNRCKVTYEGVIYGEEYDRYLQKCDIGICPQNLDALYNDSSFPSKTLSYLANGLRVVSVDLKAVRYSEIGGLIRFTKSDSAADFADAILQIDMEEAYDSRKAIADLDEKFTRDLGEMIKGYTVR